MGKPCRRHKLTDDADLAAAKRALQEATRELEETRRDNRRVDELAQRMQEIRRRNRFGDLMKRALRSAE